MERRSLGIFLAAFAWAVWAMISQPAMADNIAAENSLRPEITSSIMMIEHLRAPDCASSKVVSTTVVQPPPDQSQKAERWVLDRCGKSASYIVEYLEPTPDRISYIVKEER